MIEEEKEEEEEEEERKRESAKAEGSDTLKYHHLCNNSFHHTIHIYIK